jgi:hypothetical protein
MLFIASLGFGLLSFSYDYIYMLVFIVFFLIISVIVGGFSFSGFMFFDRLSFLLVFLRVLIFLFCYFSSLSDYWASNHFGAFGLMLGRMLLLLLIRFSCFRVILFYMSFEFMFSLMFIYLLSWGYSPERLQASFYMVFYTLVVSFPFLICLMLMGNTFVFGTFLCIDAF